MRRVVLLVLSLQVLACDPNRIVNPLGDGPAGEPRDSAAEAPAADTGTSSCTAFSGFGQGKRVAPFETSQALIDPSLRRAWLVRGGGSPGGLYELALPGGKLVKRGAGYKEIAWLGKGGELLATRPDPNENDAYALDLVRPGTALPEQLARAACFHLASPDGRYLLLLLKCKDYQGELRLLDRTRGVTTTLGTAVSRFGLVLNRDASAIAFRAAISATGSCKKGTGTLYLHQRMLAKTLKVASDVGDTCVQFTPDGQRLLFRQVAACDPQVDRLMAVGLSDTSPVELARVLAHSFQGHFGDSWGDWTLAVSPDSSRVLLAYPPQVPGSSIPLMALGTDGKGKQVLARDLIDSRSVTFIHKAWSYTADGKHVVYVAQEKASEVGLVAMSAAGGSRRRLGPGATYSGIALSHRGALVAHIGQGYVGPSLYVSDLDSAAVGRKAFTSSYWPTAFSWLPDDRGLLLAEWDKPGKRATLRYVAAGQGGATVDLTGWKPGSGIGPGLAPVDASACLVMYNLAGGALLETYLRRLPR